MCRLLRSRASSWRLKTEYSFTVPTPLALKWNSTVTDNNDFMMSHTHVVQSKSPLDITFVGATLRQLVLLEIFSQRSPLHNKVIYVSLLIHLVP